MSESYLDDQMLITRAQAGDKSAFNALIRKHETRAYQYAFRLTRNPEEASDIVADGFVRVYNALHNFKGQSAFTTWLYRILTNCYLDVRKKEKNRVPEGCVYVLGDNRPVSEDSRRFGFVDMSKIIGKVVTYK